MKKVAFTFMFLMMTSIVFAETPPNGTPEVPKDTVVKVPGVGEDVVVEVPYVVQRIHEFSPTAGNLALRGGFSVGVGFPARTYLSPTAGLIGEIGYADSSWRLHATFRAGSCKKGWGDVAFDSGLAAMRSLGKHFSIGLGTDLLYCTQVLGHPKEQASERIVGGSFHLQFEINHFSVEASAGLGAATYPVPGDRETKLVSYQGLTLSYLF
ncbi:MAG: hypothetical protein G01um101413_279 [Parcubacteria group bacterium Gr01-1014_13]|nr:MAG: hypothetical protein G01um101413_279 [Parcubacteria group bacterium Gr01-1014_13]